MNILAPSILAADFKNLGAQLEQIREAGAQYVHIDVMDGIFVPSISFGMPLIKSIRSATDRVFDVHLMIEEPVRYIKDFRESGADINVLEQYLGLCDMILIMSVEPGFGGQKFLDGSLERIRAVRHMTGSSAFAPDIEVDGGVNLEHVDRLALLRVYAKGLPLGAPKGFQRC